MILKTLIYTGYRLEELPALGESAVRLLRQIDLLIDGPFRDDELNTLQWRGSDNQRVHLLSARAQRHAAEVSRPMPERRPLQVQMLSGARYRLIGIPCRGDLTAYRAAMAARGLEVQHEHE